jgi:hypothetical protein
MRAIRLVPLVLLFMPLGLRSQNPPAQITSEGKVHITGENPGIRLLDKQGGTAMTDVNFWGVDWSPVGSGHVCFVTTRDASSKIDLRLALYDNPKLVDFVAQETMEKLVQNFNEPPYKALKATTEIPQPSAARPANLMNTMLNSSGAISTREAGARCARPMDF